MKCPHCNHVFETRSSAKSAKKRAVSDADAKVRAIVMARARGRCEWCGLWATLELDHFYGRSRDRTIHGCWALCPPCHSQKTHNRPSRRVWLERFRSHVVVHRYVDHIERIDALLAKDEGKHLVGGRGPVPE